VRFDRDVNISVGWRELTVRFGRGILISHTERREIFSA
jgi:hypothetical protein